MNHLNIKIFTFLKRNFYVEILFLLLMFFFAVLTTKGHTIAWGLLPLIYAIYKTKLLKKTTYKNFYFGVFIFFIIFILNFILLYNFKSGELRLVYSDYHFYSKIASVFNSVGAENSLTSKNILFKDLNIGSISNQYRFFETWILAFLFKTLPFNDMVIIQLIYMPLTYFIGAYAIFKNSENIKNAYVKILLSLVFLFIFGDIFFEKFLLSGLFVSLNCFISLPKLFIFYCIFIYFFAAQINKNKQHNSILFVALLPILIQVSFPLYLFVFGYMVFYYKYFKKNYQISIAIIISTIYYICFYSYNLHFFNEIFQIKQYQTVKTPLEYIHRILSIFYHNMIQRMIIFSLICSIFIYFSNLENKKNYIRIIFLSFLIIIPGLLTYSFFPSTPNSPQFLTNFFIPSLISATFLIWINTISYFSTKYFYINLIIMVILSILSVNNQMNNNRFFGSDTTNENQFIKQTENILKNVNNKIGITYWSGDFVNKNRNMSTDFFGQYGTTFLMRLGANYDVVNLTDLNTIETDFTLNINKYYSSIALFQRKSNIPLEGIQEKFYNHFKFEFLISNLSKNLLPPFIKKDINNFTYNPISKIYCYRLLPK